MSNLTNFPLCWPAGWKRTAASARKRARFETSSTVKQPDGSKREVGKRVSTSDSIERLIDQLLKLGVSTREDVVISTNVKTRLDGLPYSNQPEPDDPGVAVYWRLPNGGKTQSMAVDIYDRVADNIAAIALTLAYMRGIERHGGAEVLERVFLGFQALPPPIEWQKILAVEGRDVNLEVVEDAYRTLAKDLHPDRPGGDVEKFKELNAAIQEARRFFLGIAS